MKSLLMGVISNPAQQAGILMPAGSFTVKEIMKQIEKQTSYKFAYNNRLLDTFRILDFEGGMVELPALLKRITANTLLTFIFHEGFIIRSPELNPKAIYPDLPLQARYELFEAYANYIPSCIEEISSAPLLRPKTPNRDAGVLDQLQKLKGGKPYKYMLDNFFPYLRNAAYIRVYYDEQLQ